MILKNNCPASVSAGFNATPGKPEIYVVEYNYLQ